MGESASSSTLRDFGRGDSTGCRPSALYAGGASRLASVWTVGLSDASLDERRSWSGTVVAAPPAQPGAAQTYSAGCRDPRP